MTSEHTDHVALLEIQELLDGVEWTPDTLAEIARIMSEAGYRIGGVEDHMPHELSDEAAIAAVRALGSDIVQKDQCRGWFYVAATLADVPEGFTPREIGVRVGVWISAGDAARALLGRRQWQADAQP